MTKSRTYRTWAGAAFVAGISAAAAMALPVSAGAVQIPADSGAALTSGVDTGITQVRARGGGGGHFRGGGGHYRGGRGFYGAPLLLAPAIGYGAYRYYYDDCRVVRVREHRCWRDSDGDRHCGYRVVARRYCD